VVADFAAKIRAAIDKTAGWGDATTSDVFTQISREVDKDLWLIGGGGPYWLAPAARLLAERQQRSNKLLPVDGPQGECRDEGERQEGCDL
jgi:hypothetical protein